jgi:hypothetical protein
MNEDDDLAFPDFDHHEDEDISPLPSPMNFDTPAESRISSTSVMPKPTENATQPVKKRKSMAKLDVNR